MKNIGWIAVCWIGLGCLVAHGQGAETHGNDVLSLNDGLLLYYPFDKNTGDIVLDASGGGRTGEVIHAEWVDDGARGGAYRFDSNEQCILADDTGLPKGDEPRSMSVWIKLNVLYPEQTTGLLTYGTHRYNHLSGVGMDWRNGRNQYYFTQNGGVALSRQKMESPGEWHHLVYTYGGNGKHHLYVDGVLTDGMSELRGSLSTVLSGTLIIGGHPGSVGPNGGYLDEIRIYGRALSGSEVAELATAKDQNKLIEDEAPLKAAPPVESIAQDESLDKTPEGGRESQDVDSRSSSETPEFRSIAKVPAVTEEETMVLQWTSVPGRTYELHWTDDLTLDFTIIASDLVATGTQMSYTNVMNGARMAFYKIQIQK